MQTPYIATPPGAWRGRPMVGKSADRARPNSVAYYRNVAGFTQKGLAAALGVDGGTIYRLERGEIAFTQKRAAEIAAILGNCDASDLMRAYEPEAPLRSLGLPTEPGEMFRPLKAVDSIRSAIEAGMFREAANSARTLSALLLEMAQAPRLPVAEDRRDSGGKPNDDPPKGRGRPTRKRR